MEEYVLVTDNLSKNFGKKQAVNKVSMHIKKGSIYGFIGRNGAGKTTFMKMVSGLINPSEGTFSVLGKSGKDFDEVRNRIGCLIEAPGLYNSLSAFNNLKMKAMAFGCYNPEKINELLASVGLALCKDIKAGRFSLGMKQRLGIAMALVGDPDILILDEPINGLDPQGIIDIRNLLHRLAFEQGKTIIISSHILNELARIATDFCIIDDGKLIREFTAEELDNSSKNMVTFKVDNLTLAKAVFDTLSVSSEFGPDNSIIIKDRIEERPEFNAALVNAGVKVYEFSVLKSNIEDVYLELTGGVRNA